jgi:uncharacterized protein (DUF2147 family)
MMQKKRIITLLIFFIAGFTVYAQTMPDKILGKWMNEDKSRVLEFLKNGSVYNAIVRKAEDENFIGRQQIRGLKPDGDAYEGGTINLFKRKKTAKCTIRFINNDLFEIQGSYGVISKSQRWSRVHN